MIVVKGPKEIVRMQESGRILADILEELQDRVKPGIMTKEIDALIDRRIAKAGATPSFKGYQGFPAAACISVNEQVVHGIPDNRRLLPGDIVGVDIGACLHGYHADAARTYAVGAISDTAQRLIDTARAAFFAGIEQAQNGKRIGDIGHAVQATVESAGFSVVYALTGHGIGQDLHEDPSVPNFGRRGRGPRLTPGMALAIEPMINVSGPDVVQLEDGWTVVTRDGSLSAHYENTVVVREEGPPMVLTERIHEI